MQELTRWLSLASIVTIALTSSCDPLPRGTPQRVSSTNFSDRQAAVGTWYDAEGIPLAEGEPVVMRVSRGSGYCDWGDVLLLYLSWPLGTPYPGPGDAESIQFVRSQGDDFRPSNFATSFDADAILPTDAYDTGFHRRGWHLWVVDEEIHRSVWMVHGSVTERWPASKFDIACL